MRAATHRRDEHRYRARLEAPRGRLARSWYGIWDELQGGLTALDPGLIPLRRGLRGALSFALTVQLARGVSLLTGHDPLSMALGFSVSIFGAVAAREADLRARLVSTLCLIGASGVSFCSSALIEPAWLNHALFVALVFGVVYARRWGDRANAIGFGLFSSFFLASFLAPSPAALPWHLLGLLLAALGIFTLQLLLPQRPRAAIVRARRAIARQLEAVRVVLARRPLPAKERPFLSPRRQLGRLETTIGRARTQLETVTSGSQLRDQLGFVFFRLELAAENLSRQTAAALGDGQAPGKLLGPAFAEVDDALRALGDVAATPFPPKPDGTSASEPAAAPGRRPEPPGSSFHTRLAIQASAACALAIVAGEWLSPERWYWAVITVFVMFSGTASRGDAIYKSLQRLLGTVLGVFAGMGLVSLVGNDRRTIFLLLLGAIFLTYHSFNERFGTMSFFLTIMLALLLALMHRFSEQLLWLRLEETAVGALAGILVAVLLMSRATHSHARAQFIALLSATEDLVLAILEQLLENRATPLGAASRAFLQARDDVSAALRPFRILPGQEGRHSYVGARAQLRRTRTSLRALLAAAAPGARPLAPAERHRIELLQAGARRQLSALRALARGEAERQRSPWPPPESVSAEATDRQHEKRPTAEGAAASRPAAASSSDCRIDDITRALDELVRALSRALEGTFPSSPAKTPADR